MSQAALEAEQITEAVGSVEQRSTNGAALGVWAAIGDRGKDKGQLTSHVRLYEKAGLLYGKVIRLFHIANKDCDANPDGLCHPRSPAGRANQPIAGMDVVWDLRRNGDNRWDGKVIDPRNGRVYRCRISIHGAELRLRAYIGIPLLGRTQIWRALDSLPADWPEPAFECL